MNRWWRGWRETGREEGQRTNEEKRIGPERKRLSGAVSRRKGRCKEKRRVGLDDNGSEKAKMRRERATGRGEKGRRVRNGARVST